MQCPKDFEKLKFLQRIFKVPKVLSFRSTFEPNLPPEYGQNSYRFIQMNQNQGLISFQFSMKTIAHFKLVFFQLYCRFLYFLTIFLPLDLFLSATPKGSKKSIGFPDPGLYVESLKKKNH